MDAQSTGNEGMNMGNWSKTAYPYVACCAVAGGTGPAKDACFAVYYRRNGVKICEMVGRASQGWTARKAAQYLRDMVREHSGQWVRSPFPHVAYRVVRRHPFAPEPDRQVAVYYQADGINICRKMGWESEGWTEQRAYETLMERVRMLRLAGAGDPDDAADQPNAEHPHNAALVRRLHGVLQLRQAKDTAWAFFLALSGGGALGPALLELLQGHEPGGLARSVSSAMFGMAWANFFFACSLTGMYYANYDREERQAARELPHHDERYREYAPALRRSFAGMTASEAVLLVGLTLVLD
ncbi:hypothetical protein [Paucidesulfovibrio gracilis]|nr:hypothetical protein [Paucidesulfovibrio gracilis]